MNEQLKTSILATITKETQELDIVAVFKEIKNRYV